ncbi:MAG: GNAT family N-acetyltransferase [Salinicola sp.]|uniref:GNAT family N-acyltransferase n=1 Tax=uncultured Salinicola sp. TaxID=1193542 RepID=UPI000C8D8371|nr:GNAT family N-acyltransferase [uncultured Salinicola sp.]MAM59415.1 GNAT family N-acetyltransferase [Salinicola sp.]
MIDIAEALENHVKPFSRLPGWLRRLSIALIRGLVRESEINRFLSAHADTRGIGFVERVLDEFRFGYTLPSRERENIPVTGRVLIVANHPLGALDGLALLKMVSEVRPDVKILASSLLMQLEPLRDCLLPVDNLSRRGFRRSLAEIGGALDREEAVIVFPAGEVSRAGPHGVRDRRWQGGFLHLARRYNAPILPLHVQGRNSWLFYALTMLRNDLGTLMLPHEMFRQRDRQLRVRAGALLSMERIDRDGLSTAVKLKLLRKHVYRLGRGRKPVFLGEAGIAHPESRLALREALRDAQHLGETVDGKQILLYDGQLDGVVMRELGRLREIAFRRVGEGTGRRRDMDAFDAHYRHLLVWDDRDLEIAGAYRLGEVGRILDAHGMEGLYSPTIFHMENAPWSEWRHGLELGRSFVQPRYWGRRSLDYLWLGLGAYLRHHPEVRWLFGPVTISGRVPLRARELLVGYYRHYYGDLSERVRARAPFSLSAAGRMEAERLFGGNDRDEDFRQLRDQLEALGVSVPVLYKQYCDVAEPGGVRFMDFGVDAAFGYCLDGLVVVDVERLKPEKRRRYIGTAASVAPGGGGALVTAGRSLPTQTA